MTLTARTALRRAQAHALEDRLQGIRSRLAALESPSSAAHPGLSDDGDGDASVAAMNAEEIAAARDRLIQQERALVAAIERMRAGTYGVCSCGQPIGEARLIAIPESTLCMPCKATGETRTDRRNRRWLPEPDDVAPITTDGLSTFPAANQRGDAW